jgi:polar amino acid transport system substrate-binding protein
VTLSKRPQALALTALGLTAALALAGCGGGTDTSGASGTAGATASFDPSTVTADDTLASAVPADVSSDGNLTFGTDASYPSAEYVATDGTTIVGWDVDLGTAIANRLGLKAQWENAPFDSLITRVDSGTYEIGMSSFTINSDREAQTNMISYYDVGTAWAVQAGNPMNITPDTACGHRIAVQKATVQVTDINARSKQCTDSGQPAISVDQYGKQTDATTAVVSGKDDAMLADEPVIVYAIQQTNGQLEKTGDMYDAAPYGIVVAKPNTDLAKSVQAAVQSLIDDGTYMKILSTWGVVDGAIQTSQINPNVG